MIPLYAYWRLLYATWLLLLVLNYLLQWYLIWILIIPCSHQRFISIFVEIGGMNFCFSNKKNLIKARFNSNFSWFYFRFGVFFTDHFGKSGSFNYNTQPRILCTRFTATTILRSSSIYSTTGINSINLFSTSTSSLLIDSDLV